MTSRGQCPRGVVLVNVQEWGCFSIFRRADDVTQTMSKMGGGCLWNVFTPPSGIPVSAPVICVKFRANQPFCPPPPQPKRSHTPMGVILYNQCSRPLRSSHQ